jgi:hypothetical protein
MHLNGYALETRPLQMRLHKKAPILSTFKPIAALKGKILTTKSSTFFYFKNPKTLFISRRFSHQTTRKKQREG